jgi:hypothetical protein
MKVEASCFWYGYMGGHYCSHVRNIYEIQFLVNVADGVI